MCVSVCVYVKYLFSCISPVIVRGFEARQDVSEAAVAVQLGLALGAFDGTLQSATQEALDRERGESPWPREEERNQRVKIHSDYPFI